MPHIILSSWLTDIAPHAGRSAPFQVGKIQTSKRFSRCLRSLGLHHEASYDPYVNAAFRLNEVLNRSAVQDDQQLSELLLEEPPLSRLVLAILAGAVVVAGSSALCWLTHSDPLGGASLSEESVQASVVGALAALPLVAAKEILWTAEAQKMLPILQDLRDTRVQRLAPLINGMNTEQMGVLLVMDVVPPLIFLLTGTRGGIHAITETCVSLSIGPPMSDFVVSVLAVLAAAHFAGLVKNIEWNPTSEQSFVVQNAIKQADAYCRLTVSRKGKTIDQAAADAAAFKAVACTWLASRNMACRLERYITMVEVLYLGTLWHLTGDMCAPIVASVAMHAVDFARMKHLLDKKPLPDRRLV